MKNDNNHAEIKKLLELLYGINSTEVYSDLLSLIDKWQDKLGNVVEKQWVNQNDIMLITYGDSISDKNEKPLATLNKFLCKYANGVIKDVHILPMFPYTSDDGFSVVDYYAIDSDLGDWEDIEKLSENFGLMFDAVVNHASKSCEWFKGFLKSEENYKNYFLVSDPNADYSQVIRPRALPLLTPFETTEGVKHVWTTFSDDQIDLNYENPKVLIEILNILLTYANNGARFIRLDAIGFAWKKLGTTCMHLEETHAIVKLMRAVLDIVFPGTIIITETNVPHLDNISYFGNGFDEAQMVYQFPLPPLVLFSFITGSAAKLGKWAKSLYETPLTEGTSYFNFLASHDGIGMRPTEGILTDEEKQMMVETVLNHGGRINYKYNSDGSKSPYELNINYLDALTDPKSPDGEERISKFIAAQSILLSVVGVPGIYIHSLLGSQNWYEGVEQSGINRRINREKLDYSKVCSEIEDTDNIRHSVFNRFSEIIRLRGSQSAFSPIATQQVVFVDDRVFSFIRHNSSTNEKIFVAVNVSKDEFMIKNPYKGFDIINNEDVGSEQIRMMPYQVRWIKLQK